MRKKTSQKLVIGVILLSVFILALLQNMKIAYAQTHEEIISLDQNFLLEEFSENKDLMENVTSIDIDLGSSRWNVTDIELNFTDIEFTRELKEIETHDVGFQKAFYKKIIGLAVQINISEPTEIYAIHLHGQVVSENTSAPIFVEIQGYDDSTNKPNGTVYGSTYLNMTGSYNWYIQNFSKSFVLSAGKYYLVIQSFGMTQSDGALFSFSYNIVDPKYPYLYTWENEDGGDWTSQAYGEPLLYKLDQKISGTFNLISSNMTAEINGTFHPVLEGIESDGYLNLENIDFSPNDKILQIPIKNNRSDLLIFNLSYRIKLENNFLTSGTLKINTNQEIEWNVNFNLNRSDGNYTVKFSYPNSWTIFSVLKNDNLLTHGVDYINNTAEKAIYILNNSIPDEIVPWKITAESENIPIDFIEPDPVITAGSESISGVNFPLNGTYTYVLYGGIYEKYRNTTTYNGEPLTGGILPFPYIIPDEGPNGDWTAVMYWNNGTDAGVKTESFIVSGGTIIVSGGGGGGGGGGGSTTVTGLEPLLVLTISLIIIFAIAGSLTSYQMVKRVKRKRAILLLKLRNKVIDSLNLNYIMISENTSGLNVFEQFFGGKEIDPTLISGFLSAIRSFGIELTGTYQQSQTIKLEFQNSKILMNEFRNFRLILLMGENPSEDLIESLDTLAQDVEKTYGDLIRDFDGELIKFKGIGELIEHHLNVSFLYPFKVISSEATKLTRAERSVLNKAKEIMKQNNLSYIFTSFLMDDQTYEPKRIKAIFGLIDKGVFQPIRLEDQNFKQ